MINNYNLANLVEVKKGQVGTGLLIENDGYVSRDVSEYNKKIIKEAFDLQESGEWHVPNPFVLDVVLQKFGIQNANGRIYPEDVLKREVEKYQKLIDERMALGECYTPDAECLTPNGWASIVDIKEGDEVITLNVETKKTEIQKVTYKTCNDWNGELFHVMSLEEELGGCKLASTKGVDDIVTPNHSYPLVNMHGDFIKFATVEDISQNCNKEYIGYGVPITKECDMDVLVRNFKFEKVPYNGKVYCIEVPNHTWYVRQNGKSHWTKNCNHPSESTIDLGRISHNIVECHWEGHTLMGKIEFNLTEGFRRYGICSSLGDTCANLIMNGYKIGVSSRGVGSVKSQFGKTIVQDDYEIICWDVVATPSTPGSYIGSKEQLQQYVETKETDGTALNEKINKIKNLLN